MRHSLCGGAAGATLTLSLTFTLTLALTLTPTLTQTQTQTLTLTLTLTRYDLTGLHIALDGRGYVDGAAVPGWQPQPHWRFGMGAFNSDLPLTPTPTKTQT